MGTLSEFLVGDTPVMARAGFAEIPDMAAQIEPTMSRRKRSIARSLDRGPGRFVRCGSRPDVTRERATTRIGLRQFLTEAPRTMRPKRRAGASIAA
jgi:hypothetical protein